MSNLKILVIFGTRPEAIKMAPVIAELSRRDGFEVKVCFSGQHREMVEQVLAVFGIRPDFDLAVMKRDQSLADVTVGVLSGLEELFRSYRPDMILVQGDTTTVLASALAAFYHRIPVGHVEAGLRTGDRFSPYPEEMNRLLATRLSDLHFAPTETAKRNLLRENVAEAAIRVTGNTVIDALFAARDKLLADNERFSELETRFSFLDPGKKTVLVTGHRRENHGDGIRNLCSALRTLARRGDVELVYPVHPNPSVSDVAAKELAGVENVHLIPPLDYLSFIYLMRRSFFVVSDSGGVQEEAPSLGKPVLVVRESTERPEAVAAGTCRLVGADPARIVAESELLLDDPGEYRRRASIANPFGDGRAAVRIAEAVEEYFSR